MQRRRWERAVGVMCVATAAGVAAGAIAGGDAASSEGAGRLSERAAGQVFALIFVVVAIGLLAVFGLLLWLALSRGRSLRREAERAADARRVGRGRRDAWEESAARLRVEDAEGEGDPAR